MVPPVGMSFPLTLHGCLGLVDIYRRLSCEYSTLGGVTSLPWKG